MKLGVITSNPGKVEEYRRYFERLGVETVHMRIPYDEIQSSELEEVVRKGMDELKRKGVSDFLIDDSGLFINDLKGFPGVWSAYVQKTIGNDGILKIMDGVEDRSAVFKCCIGCNIGGRDIVVTGVCGGTILERSRGTEGFGYDPIFSHDGVRSFAEIPIDEKNAVSHRGVAAGMLTEEMMKTFCLEGKP
ncbi:MAG: RdgB/HAM1 family non-canonical purine NTP pyrophosphatase [Candidatus Methanoplasma sp.]|jgi:XTP/dITP diphosphohydrolase|nr:RdgB/HAM1 family non-canonical purine NTP pyrophosphatase [Candidatus Methanoplasma sp.]